MKPGLTRYRVKPIPDREYLGHPKGDGRMDLGVPGIGVITVPMEMLIPVLPLEPDFGAVVRAGTGTIFQRVSIHSEHRWKTIGSMTLYTWAQICNSGTPTVLVDDPMAGAPELPYHTGDFLVHSATDNNGQPVAMVWAKDNSSRGVTLAIGHDAALAILKATS